MPKKTQNKISKTALNHYNKLKSVRTEALGWVQIATDTVMKLKFETTIKERDQQLLESITIDVINIEQKQPSIQDIIPIYMTPIINSSFNKHPM